MRDEPFSRRNLVKIIGLLVLFTASVKAGALNGYCFVIFDVSGTPDYKGEIAAIKNMYKELIQSSIRDKFKIVTIAMYENRAEEIGINNGNGSLSDKDVDDILSGVIARNIPKNMFYFNKLDSHMLNFPKYQNVWANSLKVIVTDGIKNYRNNKFDSDAFVKGLENVTIFMVKFKLSVIPANRYSNVGRKDQGCKVDIDRTYTVIESDPNTNRFHVPVRPPSVNAVLDVYISNVRYIETEENNTQIYATVMNKSPFKLMIGGLAVKQDLTLEPSKFDDVECVFVTNKLIYDLSVYDEYGSLVNKKLMVNISEIKKYELDVKKFHYSSSQNVFDVKSGFAQVVQSYRSSDQIVKVEVELLIQGNNGNKLNIVKVCSLKELDKVFSFNVSKLNDFKLQIDSWLVKIRVIFDSGGLNYSSEKTVYVKNLDPLDLSDSGMYNKIITFIIFCGMCYLLYSNGELSFGTLSWKGKALKVVNIYSYFELSNSMTSHISKFIGFVPASLQVYTLLGFNFMSYDLKGIKMYIVLVCFNLSFIFLYFLVFYIFGRYIKNELKKHEKDTAEELGSIKEILKRRAIFILIVFMLFVLALGGLWFYIYLIWNKPI